jgi:hypothetical protein
LTKEVEKMGAVLVTPVVKATGERFKTRWFESEEAAREEIAIVEAQAVEISNLITGRNDTVETYREGGENAVEYEFEDVSVDSLPEGPDWE